jgi:hypothetical protein
MTGETQVEEPRTEAGRDMAGTMEQIVAGLAALATTPRRATRADIVVKVRAIEDEARAATLTAVEEAVAGLRAMIGGPLDPSHPQAKADALDAVLAAITALRQPQEAKDTRGEPR